jgi:hypothetical protein
MEKSELEDENGKRTKGFLERIKQLEERLEDAQTAYSASENRRAKVEERLVEVKRDNQQLKQEKVEYEKEAYSLAGEVEQYQRQLVQRDEDIEVIRANSTAYLDAWIASEKSALDRKVAELTETIEELTASNKFLVEAQALKANDSSVGSETMADVLNSSVTLTTAESSVGSDRCEECLRRATNTSCVGLPSPSDSLQAEMMAMSTKRSFETVSVQTEEPQVVVSSCQTEYFEACPFETEQSRSRSTSSPTSSDASGYEWEGESDSKETQTEEEVCSGSQINFSPVGLQTDHIIPPIHICQCETEVTEPHASSTIISEQRTEDANKSHLTKTRSRTQFENISKLIRSVDLQDHLWKFWESSQLKGLKKRFSIGMRSNIFFIKSN